MIQLPNIKPESTTSLNEDVCPKCKGTGWEHWTTTDGSEEIYGFPLEVTYARKCNCQKLIQENEDRTEFPSNLRSANISAFKWDAYSGDMSDMKAVVHSFYYNFDEWKKEGKGLYLWSKTPGSGKTFLAACLSKSIMFKTQYKVKYITPTDYMDKVSEGYRNKKNGIFEDPSRVYREVSILVLDDIGTQKNDEWHNQELFRLIDERLSNGRVTIFTSNLSVENLNVDERIKSRILKAVITIHMSEESVRNKLANEEQGDFVKRMLGGKNG